MKQLLLRSVLMTSAMGVAVVASAAGNFTWQSSGAGGYSGSIEDELLAVGEGKDVCTYYLARRTLDGRREYLLHGLDVTAELPEAVALLDGILTDAMKK